MTPAPFRPSAETEQVHGKIRRYTSPDEHPYFPEYQPPLVLPPINYPQEIHQASRDIERDIERKCRQTVFGG